MKIIRKNIFTGIDLFSGAGGMSLGAEKAGIQINTAIEKDIYSARTYKTNYKYTNVITKNIEQLEPNIIFNEQLFVMFGGPPCQGFSVSNTKTRNLENPKNRLFKEFIRFVKILKPVWIIFENVEGFSYFDKGSFVNELKSEFFDLGYTNLFSDILNASDFGVPQNRKRFFIVGNNQDIKFTLPKKVNLKITVHEAIHDLPSLENGSNIEKLPYKTKPLSKYAEKMRNGSKTANQNFVSRNKEYVINRYKYIKPGENWEAIPNELMQNYKNLEKCHSGIYKRLDPNEISVVIANFRKNMLIHPYEDRGLSIREAARLQSFPDSFIFEGSLNSMQQQIGNAVPPLLAEAIFRNIIEYHR